MINSTETLFIVLVALLPGFVAQIAFQTVVSRATPTGTYLLLQSLGFAVVNASLHAWWLAPLLVKDASDLINLMTSAPIWSTILALIYTAISPFLIGYGFGLVRFKLRLPGMKHHAPTAWDKFFGAGPGCIVYAVLRDGTRIAGLYNSETGGFASSYPHPETIFCGREFPLDTDGRITGPPPNESLGVLIRGDDCILLQFLVVPTMDQVENLFTSESTDGKDNESTNDASK